MSEYDVIIVGGGVSGMSAAHKLRKKEPELKVLVLEAKDRLGGRTFTTAVPCAGGDTEPFDLGGQWVGKTQTYVMELLKELDIEVYPQYYSGTKLIQVGSANRIKEYTSSIPNIGILPLLDLSRLISKVEAAAKGIPKDNPGHGKRATELDSMTAETYIRGMAYTQETVDSIAAAFRVTFGAEMADMSALYVLADASAAGSLSALVESSPDSGQGFKIAGGAQQISLRLADILGHENVKLSSPVRGVTQTEDSVTVATSSGEKFTSKKVILAIPPHLYSFIEFSPILSVVKNKFSQMSPPGHLIKFIITYEKAFWRELGYSGEMVTNGGVSRNAACSRGPLSVVFDATSSKNTPALVGFIGGIQALEHEGLSLEARREAVISSLEDFLPKDEVRDYIAYVEKNWRLEEFNGGCPVNVAAPGAARFMGSAGQVLPEGHLHVAGTESASDWRGFISGAIQSGYRAAEEVLACLHEPAAAAVAEENKET